MALAFSVPRSSAVIEGPSPIPSPRYLRYLSYLFHYKTAAASASSSLHSKISTYVPEVYMHFEHRSYESFPEPVNRRDFKRLLGCLIVTIPLAAHWSASPPPPSLSTRESNIHGGIHVQSLPEPCTPYRVLQGGTIPDAKDGSQSCSAPPGKCQALIRKPGKKCV